MKKSIVLLWVVLAAGLLFREHSPSRYVFEQDPQHRFAVADPDSLTAWQQSWGKRARQRARAAGIALPEPQPNKKPSTYFRDKRAWPDPDYDFERKLQADRATRILQSRSGRERDIPWELAGPSNIGGRITALAVSRQDPDIIYAGAADGGVLKTTTGGTTWEPRFDTQFSLSIGALAVHPRNHDIIYVGTGEANLSSDSYHGDGIYKSLDGGQTWTHQGLPDSRRIGRIALLPDTPDTIFVAVTGNPYGAGSARGLYRSRDGGATWTRVHHLNSSTGAIDVVVHPGNPNLVYYASFNRSSGIYNRIYRSQDGGETWEQLTAGLPAGSNTGRIGLALCRTQPQILYAIYADRSTGYFMGVYKSLNGGQTWTRTNDGALANMYSSYGWWFGNIRVAPDDPQRVYALGLDIWQSLDGGNSWNNISYGQIHVDQHDLQFAPQVSTTLISGNDGGVYVSHNDGDGWIKSYNLPVTQFYMIAVDPADSRVLYGGTQDNGSLKGPSGVPHNWYSILGGDGFYCLVDPANSNIVFAEYQFGNLYKSVNGGQSMDWAMNGINDNDRRNWSTPVCFDPGNSQVMYYGSYRVWKSTNQAGNWFSVSGDLTNGGTISTLDVSPLDGNVVYAGTSDANLWRSLDGGNLWQPIDQGLPQRYITGVAASPHAAAGVFVCLSGYFQNDFTSHIFYSEDYGTTWTGLAGNLPNTPTNAVIQDPAWEQVLYLATDHGLFVSLDFGGTWSVLGDGLPNSVVDDIDLHAGDRLLLAGTHGRSIWKISVSGVHPDLPGDLNQDGLVNITDFVRLIQLVMEYADPAGPEEVQAADLVADGTLDVRDVLVLADLLLTL